MPGHRKILVLAVSVLLTGCIEEFVPKIEETQNALVVNGTITDQEGYQYVEISRTSSYLKLFPILSDTSIIQSLSGR
ncbi:hypothetical protein ES703_25350 [subsurface metagenome]